VIVPALLLAVASLAALQHVAGNDFIDFDDDEYVTKNPYVQAGLTSEGFWWALTAFHSNNWHPLTWWSLELDCGLFGNKPWGFHLTNLLLHTANVVLLYWVLFRMTGAVWRSAVVAAFFGVHPLHVESVAWVSERKDVLGALFWILTLLAYVRYGESPGWGRYALLVAAFAAGLMAKPMLVTLPFVLLLLDYWPLGRWQPSSSDYSKKVPAAWPVIADRMKPVSLGRLLGEKVPLLVLAGACSLATLAAQERVVQTWSQFPWSVRLQNALVTYVVYVLQMCWPRSLAFFYPYPDQGLPAWETCAAAAFLAAVTVWVVLNARKRPFLLVGWLWYVGTLIPVIGLVQVGLQAHADRYTYLPLIGLFLMVGWGLPTYPPARPVWRRTLVAGTVAALLVCVVASRIQASYWRDSMTLWQHTLAVTPTNFMAHHHLGMLCLRQGDFSAAHEHFASALAARPEVAVIHFGQGMTYYQEGKLPEAAPCFAEAVHINRDYAEGHYYLGLASLRLGDLEEAIRQFLEVTRLRPGDRGAWYNLGAAYYRQGQLEAARRCLAEYGRLAGPSRPEGGPAPVPAADQHQEAP
jgi:hypothetical protein